MIDAPLLARLPAIVVTVLAYGAAAFAVVVAASVIRRIARGDTIEFAGLRVGSDAQLGRLKGAIDELDLDIRVKTNVIRALRRLLRDLAALHAAPRDRRAASSAELLYDTLLELAAAISDGPHDYHRASLWVPTADDRHLTMRAAFNFRPDAVGEARLSIDGSIAGWVYRRKQLSISDNVYDEREFERLAATSHEYRSVLAVPVAVNARVLGVLAVDAQEAGYFTGDHAFFAETFAELIAAVLLSEQSEDRNE